MNVASWTLDLLGINSREKEKGLGVWCLSAWTELSLQIVGSL